MEFGRKWIAVGNELCYLQTHMISAIGTEPAMRA
ncbi:hypothetical protein AIIKEEIJ_00156 [Rhodococcus sp. YH1]|nr:hypothetical protein [Rhodococcus sp. YH1]